ncbi:aminotransferase class I/II-fold pyridoxal phosphate-dependent enzyme [Marinomonas colpomeniae]|uniref:Aminotransferase n=1 Tax=Marinomonas colpomeniae TaxID=2774408 RepID=A0ABR8NZV4_9GAMM|nr:aminotransferase class I/II-fold pyridoxal phosphate-dependent enzyme [Marinomonas colpomeniae]MBD5771145.1 aminotransferase class I/II-fold pyridoxal phosphate-dependent enzyme [Marinomonas colpomeniae]
MSSSIVFSGDVSSDKKPSKLNAASPKHGGDLAYWQRKVGNDALNWLDLSSACNREPWPVPTIDPELWMTLPDQTALLDAAEKYYGHRPNAVGAGSQHIIESLPLLIKESLLIKASRSLKNNIVFVPRMGYQEHAFAWQKWGFELAYYDSIDSLFEQAFAVAVIIQPNNPTGEWAKTETLSALVDHSEQQGASLIVDEAFVDSCPELSLLAQRNNDQWPEPLFVLRSVGKFFGLAGARVGFVFCADKWQQVLKNLMGPWPVATPSLHLVSLAFSDVEWQTQAFVSLKQRQSAFIERVMPKFNTIFDSQDSTLNALFITWHLGSDEYAKQVFTMLHQVGIHTRLGEGWIRVALPAMGEMEMLDRALIRLLKSAGNIEFKRGELA